MQRFGKSALVAGVTLMLAGAMPAAGAQGVARGNAAVPAGGAGTFYLDQRSSGSGVCAAALPAFEGLVRKRPLALQNEGTATAFVSCAPPQFTGIAGDPQLGLEITLVNLGDAPATVNCTGVSAVPVAPLGGGEVIEYIPLSATIPAGGRSSLSWGESDGAGDFTSVSCGLPPGTGIGDVWTYGASVVSGDGPVL